MKMLHCQSLKEIRVSTPAENRVGNSSVRKGFDTLVPQAFIYSLQRNFATQTAFIIFVIGMKR